MRREEWIVESEEWSAEREEWSALRASHSALHTSRAAPRAPCSSDLVAVGGDLHPQRLLRAYRAGVFPWYDEGMPVCWWSPDPRAVFELDGMHVPRRLARTIRSKRYRCTMNHAFGQVIRGCADRTEGTWITPDMIEAYERLHRLGVAHSVEVWHSALLVPKLPLGNAPSRNSVSLDCSGEEQLVGGLYGVAIGGLFAGESMFSRRRDASKVALAFLMNHLRRRRFELIDIQMLTEHTQRLGAVEIPRAEYLRRLQCALLVDTTFTD
ncbi:MAG: leucyl/phenylalanyl-tRNA--protein transferase [Gemmataceae bacterium]|nr:leucyl/phenylalanyl-tRNA--protein transferase [Gemmataceae bacterium]MCI0739538.1 leucyl/phenylalanyl-tRNA--protein transferase [Gemmataceae bacterium]